MEELEEEEKRFDFINIMFAGIDPEQRCVYDKVVFYKKDLKLKASKKNPRVVLPSPWDLKDLRGRNLRDFVYKTVPSVELSPQKVAEIQTCEFEEMLEKQEELAKKLEDMTEQQKMERQRKRRG